MFENRIQEGCKLRDNEHCIMIPIFYEGNTYLIVNLCDARYINNKNIDKVYRELKLRAE